MSQQLELLGAISGILGLIIAVLALLRDVYDLKLSPPAQNSIFGRVLKSRTFLPIISILLFVLFGLSFYSQIRNLSTTLSEQEQELGSAYIGQTAQALTINELRATPTPVSNVLFLDDFETNRPSGGSRIQLSSEISFTTNIRDGLFVVDINNPSTVMFSKIIRPETISDFDVQIAIGDIAEKVSIGVTFRKSVDKWGNTAGYRFYAFPGGEAKGSWAVRGFDDKPNIRENRTDFERLESLRVKCQKERCDFYINTDLVASEIGFANISGGIELEFFGSGIARIEEVRILSP